MLKSTLKDSVILELYHQVYCIGYTVYPIYHAKI